MDEKIKYTMDLTADIESICKRLNRQAIQLSDTSYTLDYLRRTISNLQDIISHVAYEKDGNNIDIRFMQLLVNADIDQRRDHCLDLDKSIVEEFIVPALKQITLRLADQAIAMYD